MSCIVLLQIDLVNAKDLETLAQRIKVNLLNCDDWSLSVAEMAKGNLMLMVCLMHIHNILRHFAGYQRNSIRTGNKVWGSKLGLCTGHRRIQSGKVRCRDSGSLLLVLWMGVHIRLAGMPFFARY